MRRKPRSSLLRSSFFGGVSGAELSARRTASSAACVRSACGGRPAACASATCRPARPRRGATAASPSWKRRRASTRCARLRGCGPHAPTPAEEAAIRAEVGALIRPLFVSRRYGDPGYGQLELRCAAQIRTGAESGAEMGAFEFLKQPQREANLRDALDEYLRFGLEAGLVLRHLMSVREGLP